MRNVTITLPDDLAKWARVEAAKADMSLSAWIAERVDAVRAADNAHRHDAFMREMKPFFDHPGHPLSENGRMPTKNEIDEGPDVGSFDERALNDLVTWARFQAEDEGLSLGQWLDDRIVRTLIDRRRAAQRNAFDAIMNLDGLPVRSEAGPPPRDEIYDDLFHRHESVDLSDRRTRAEENDDEPRALERSSEHR